MKKLLTVLVLMAMMTGAVLAPGACADRGGAGLTATLTVREPAGVARQGEPVTAGIPVARAAGVTSTGGLRLLDAAGREVPAQFKVTSRWGGSPSDASLPARWVLVDFQADVAANGSASYTVSDGGSGAPATALSVTRNDADALAISTGAGTFTFSKRRFSILESVNLGAGDIIGPGGATGVFALDTSGGQYASWSAPPDHVVLETDGPMRKTVRMRGPLAGPSGELVDCIARVSLFAGRADARVQLTVRNPREPQVVEGQPQFHDIGCPESAAIESLDLLLGCGPVSMSVGGVAGGEFTAGDSVEVYQDSSGGGAWDRYRGMHPRPQSYVSFKGYSVARSGALVATGDRAEPWLDGSGGAGGLAVSLRDFWQNYPKALRGGSGRLEVSLFPGNYAGPYSLRPGEQKTHEVALCFHAPGGEPAARGRAVAAQDPLVASPPPAYTLATGALGRVAGPTGDAEFAAYEALNSSTVAGAANNLFKVIEDAEFYSWQDYGEQPVDFENGGTGSLNQKYNFDYGMLLQYLRTGEEAWLRLADAAGRHTADLDVYHHDGAPAAWWDGGFFGHSYHDEESNTNPNRNAGAPHPDLVFGAPGLFLRYYLTGDPVAYDSAVEIADNVRYRFDNSFGRGNEQGYAEAPDDENGCLSPRPFAHGLWVLVEAYRGTGDAGYLVTSEWLIQNSHQATDLFITQPVAGDRRYTKVFTWDLLENSLGKYLDLCAEMGRNDPSGARDQLVSMASQEAHVMWKQDSAGNKGVPYAWMRDGTPWGWEDSEVAVNVCNWHLLTADALTYGYVYGGDASLLDRAREAFKTGSSPNVEYYEPVYTATKEATNSANFGLAYMHLRYPPTGPVSATQFEEWLCLENDSGTPANVTIEYYTGEGRTTRQVLQVSAASRRTVSVNEAVGWGQDVSAKVTSDVGIVAERPMYFDYHNAWPGGHVSSGAPAPAARWYFAEGCTRTGFEEWLTIENAQGTAATVTLTFMTEAGPVSPRQVSAPASARTTVNVNDIVGPEHDVSALVESDAPVVVERPVYFRYRDKWSGGHDSLGALEPSTAWYFGEGTTRANPADGSYEEWLCLQNPGAGQADAHVSFLLDGGGTVERDYRIAPASRFTIDVNLEVGSDRDVSAVVTSEAPLVAERPMYFSTREGWDGGDVAMGSVAPAASRLFAEGCTRDGFQTWVSIGNPHAEPVETTIDYFTASGKTQSRQVTVPAKGRSTVDVNLDIGPQEDVSWRVSAGKPVIAERPMYFSYHGKWPGGHVGTGSPAPGTEWHFAEGCTR